MAPVVLILKKRLQQLLKEYKFKNQLVLPGVVSEAMELSQRLQTAVQIVSKPPVPISGGPIHPFFWVSRPCRPAGWTGAAPHKSR